MKIAIMQPYLFPYIGYFQLMNVVDEFIVYDNIQFTKKGWINRNRILVNGTDSYITAPLKDDSDYLNIVDRRLADTWPLSKKKILNRISETYKKAPCFASAYPLVEEAIACEENNLFKFIFHSLVLIKEYLDIQTPLIVSSSVSIDHALRSEDKVIELCKARKADSYINPIGGVELYDKGRFESNRITLQFIKTSDFVYQQFNNDFVPFLSIIDVIMFNSKQKTREYLEMNYTLL